MTKEQTNSWGKDASNILIGMWMDLIHRKNSASVKDVKNYAEQYEEKRDRLFNLISKTISQEKEKMIEEIKKLKTYHKIETNPEMTAKGIKHGRAIMTVDRQEVINILQNK